MLNVYEQVDSNKRKSFLIMVLFVLFVTGIIYLFNTVLDFGTGWLGIALIFSGLSSLGSYYWGDKFILAISGARPADRKRDFTFYTVTENLCLAASLPMPKLYVINDTAPNAFATGRDPQHATVCSTTGLLSKLNRTELEGVIAHELSHVRNYDTRLMAVVTILIGMIALISDWFMRSLWWRDRDRDRGGNLQAILLVVAIIAAILAPIIGQLMQLAISRRREFFADASGVMLTRQPGGLISALKKISGDTEPLEAANRATASLYIINPFKSSRGQQFVGWFSRLFDTHPPISERIKALEGME
ncbi:M48 family metallopeptidase [Candidatus Microgenomates bacterium]|nr:M48 family metallopeptidase [Candidatus Microgenomates bacterium]